jgi:undecaprenyl-diphosphatase
MWFELFKAFVLGAVEGLTEFLPVSSTGHLLLLRRFFGFGAEDFGAGFAMLIELGALLALVSVYFLRLWGIAAGLWSDPAARRFVLGVIASLLPAALIGALAHEVIMSTLLNVWIVCFALIVGGAILLWVDQLDLKPRHLEATGFSLPMCFGIGIAQCLALVPGVSRSGATIVAAMLLGADARAAAEYSLWLAIPMLGGILVCDIYQNHGRMSGENALLIAVGFAASFIAAWFVARTFLAYVSRHGLRLFAWWRVIVGSLGLIALALGR